MPILMKDPAFLFYPSDFLTGVTDLTMEERGQYITLLCLQHQKGHLTEKTIRLSLGSVSNDVLAKFTKTENGEYFNERLEIEIEKRASFVDSRRNNGAKGGRPKASAEPNGLPSVKPLAKPKGKPRKNLPINEDVNKDTIKIVMPFDSELFNNAWQMWKEYKKEEHKFKYASIESEQAALMSLSTLSKGNEQTALAIIHQSMAAGWKGFFELKNNNNGQNSKDVFATSIFRS